MKKKIFNIPEDWVTHKCHTSFKDNKIIEKEIFDEYQSVFNSVIEKEWKGSIEYWWSVYKDNEYQEWHNHMPGTLSAIHFLNFKDEHLAPIFEDPNKSVRSIIFRTALNKDLSSDVTYTPKVEEGDIIIFPGWLEHQALPNEDESPRIILGTNYFVTGKLGRYENKDLISI